MEDGEDTEDGQNYTQHEDWHTKPARIHIIPNDDPPIPTKIPKQNKKIRFNLDLTPVIPKPPPQVDTPKEQYIPRPRSFEMDIQAPILERHKPVIPPTAETRKMTLMTEYLEIHHRFQHIPFKRLNEMSKQGIID